MALEHFHRQNVPDWLFENGKNLEQQQGCEWVALQVNGNQTLKLVRLLRSLKLSFFHPVILEKAKSGKKDFVCRSLWQGYVFCKLKEETVVRHRNLRHVSKLIRTKNQNLLVKQLLKFRDKFFSEVGFTPQSSARYSKCSNFPFFDKTCKEFRCKDEISHAHGIFY